MQGIRLDANIVLGLHEVEEVVIIPLDSSRFCRARSLSVNLKPFLTRRCNPSKSPQENALGLGGHLFGDIRVVYPVGGLVLGGQDQLPPVEAVRAIIDGL